MEGQKLEEAKNAAKFFVAQLDLADDQVGLVTFATTATLDVPLSHDGSTFAAVIDAVTVGHGTNIADGVDVAQTELVGSRHNPVATSVIILLSDGRANTGGSPQATADVAKTLGIRVITIGLGNNANQDLLRSMASSTDDYYFAPTSVDLMDIYRRIAGVVHCSH